MSSSEKQEWSVLWDKAKAIEASLPALKQQAYNDLKSQFPELTYKTFHTLRQAFLSGKLRDHSAQEVAHHHERIQTLEQEARDCRSRSDELLIEMRESDTRKVLDPKVDPIPPGQYPKLRSSCVYPLRQNCNDGENETSKWERCEYMTYDNSCSIYDMNRWNCAAPEEK